MYRLLIAVLGLSQLGGWLEVQGIRWYQVDSLHQVTWMASVTFLCIKLCGLSASLGTFPKLERRPAAQILFVGQALLSVTAGTMAALAFFGRLDVISLTVTASVAAALEGVMVKPYVRFQKEFAGSNQQKLGFLTSQSSYIGRVIAGASSGLLNVYGSWLPFAINALTFPPFSIFLLFYALRRGEALPKRRASKAEKKREKKERRKSRFAEAAKPKEKPATALEGLRYILGHKSLRMLFALDAIRVIFFQGIPFNLTPEIIRLDYHQDASQYGAWMAVTGLAGFIGSFLAARLRLGTRSMVVSLLLSAVCNVGSALSPRYEIYLMFYLAYVALWAPPATLISAEWRLTPKKWAGAIQQVNEVVLNGFGPLTLLGLTWLGTACNLRPRTILLVTSITGIASYMVVAYLIKIRGLSETIITGKDRHD